jgi:pimeloyl-ACP methyl ester carboxylesterase
LYQAQAEATTVTSTPAGDPPNLAEARLPAADALILLNAHPGRARALVDWLDPSVVDERDPLAVDASLDMYDARNGPPYSPEFLDRYRAAQLARNRRITRWVQAKLAQLASHGHQGTDPRFLDLGLDPSDRVAGTYWGDARAANYQAAGFGRFTTLRCWLSQWGIDTSQALAEANITACTVPLLIIQGTADQGVFNTDVQRVFDAATMPDRQLQWLRGGTHFFAGQPELATQMYQLISHWLAEREMHAI